MESVVLFARANPYIVIQLLFQPVYKFALQDPSAEGEKGVHYLRFHPASGSLAISP